MPATGSACSTNVDASADVLTAIFRTQVAAAPVVHQAVGLGDARLHTARASSRDRAKGGRRGGGAARRHRGGMLESGGPVPLQRLSGPCRLFPWSAPPPPRA
jgi:hypothetical protein